MDNTYTIKSKIVFQMPHAYVNMVFKTVTECNSFYMIIVIFNYKRDKTKIKNRQWLFLFLPNFKREGNVFDICICILV